MKRFWQWVSDNVVWLLAVLAALMVVVMTVLSSVEPNPWPIEPDDRPWIYDLSLAYLAGFIFHLLVVVLPERRKQKALLGALHGYLMLVANNGNDLIRELELIAQCPRRPITSDHISKVLTALNDTPAVRSFIAMRLHVADRAFSQLIPYMAALPLSLQMSLQQESQLHLHNHFREHYDPSYKHSLSALRKETTDVKTLRDAGFGSMATRTHFGNLVRLFEDYYSATEAVRAEVVRYQPKVMPKTPYIPTTPRIFYFWDLVRDRRNETGDYPPTATSDKPLELVSKQAQAESCPQEKSAAGPLQNQNHLSKLPLNLPTAPKLPPTISPAPAPAHSFPESSSLPDPQDQSLTEPTPVTFLVAPY